MKVLTRRLGIPHSSHIDSYLMGGGYTALPRALFEMQPEEVIEQVRDARLRGRGGAGFPTGMKWDFVAHDARGPKTVVANADEGEPGTFKDRLLLEGDPHALLEGMALAAYAVGATRGFIYVRGEYGHAARVLAEAIASAEERNFLGRHILRSPFSFTVTVHRGAGGFVCGEETALLESLEGKRGKSRVRPPFPVNCGYLGLPTVINNVETLANIAPIILHGGKWFSRIGSPECPGTKLFSVSGHVARPGVYELPLGIPLREVIFTHAGGMRGERPLKAVLPGGASSSCLTAAELDVPCGYNSLAEAGSMLGSGAVIVMEEGTDMVEAAALLVRFFTRESCGKCTPCREGLFWVSQVVERIRAGCGRAGDLDLLLDLARGIRSTSFCGLGDVSCNALASFIQRFRPEWEARIPA